MDRVTAIGVPEPPKAASCLDDARRRIATVAAALLTTAWLAALVPAWRASRTDPAGVLREGMSRAEGARRAGAGCTGPSEGTRERVRTGPGIVVRAGVVPAMPVTVAGCAVDVLAVRRAPVTR